MAVYYLETSALVKRYKTELGSELVSELFEGKSPSEIFITSQFTLVEIEATLARALKARLLKSKAYQAILGLLSVDLVETVVIQPISGALIQDAARLARAYALRASDAVHVATILRISRTELATVIPFTSDDELLHVMKAEGLESLDPRQTDAPSKLRRLRRRG